MLSRLEALGADDVSMAWTVWSRAAESALLDAYRFSGGSLPSRSLVLGRGSSMFRVVRLGGHPVRKARGSVADVHDAADVFLYRDASLAPLLDMRRRFKAVMDVLDAMIRLNLLLSGTRFWHLGLCILLPLMIYLLIKVWVLVPFSMLPLVSIVVLVTSFMLWLFADVMRRLGGGAIGFVKIPWFIPVSLISRLVVLGYLLILLGLMRNSERLGFPTFVALGKGIPALRNSILRLRNGCLFYLRFLPRLTGRVLADVVQRKGATAGSLDGWGGGSLKVFPVSWYDELARILRLRILVFGLMVYWMLNLR